VTARRVALVGALGPLLALGAGCSTTYQPRPSPRIGLVVHGGTLSYVQNGRETPVGPLGGDLGALVGGNPQAAAQARTARTELAVGVPAYLVGIGAVVLGLWLLDGNERWVAAGAGAGVAGTGLGLMGAGFTHLLDAVNIHGDSLR
jgi:hypothetical protein